MDNFDRNNSVNSEISDNTGNNNDEDPDNNGTQNTDNENTATNVLHRNNFTTRDHLFQAMFTRIALIYDRTFPPFARRFIEFMLLITALSVLFVLIYIHLAFVKAPITCLDHFSFEQPEDGHDTSFKHAVIRVEIISNPPFNYGLFHSYSKEYDDMNAVTNSFFNVSSKLRSNNELNQMVMFLNVIFKRCHKVSSGNDSGGKDTKEGMAHPEKVFGKEKTDQNQSEGSFYRLFHFPINPIIEKAEYWREKLSVRAMAPFRQTFNELELFAKSVFAEEKYIMEYSLEYGLLRLSPQIRERLNIPVHFIVLDATKDKCFGNALSRFILQEFVGYDQIIIGSLKRLAERQSGKGYVRNVVSGEHYRFVNSWMSRTSYLAAGFIMIIFTLSVSMLLRYSHHQIFVFIVDLLRMLENNLQFSFPAAPLLTVVLALVGMEAIMSEFFNDTSTAFYTILIIWLADQYEAVCCRAYVSKRHWPRYFYLYHFAFYAYHYRFNGQFSGLALLCSWLFIQHSMFFFFHHYELPRLMQRIAVRAIMDSLIVERAEDTSLTPSPLYPNEDDDMPGGDRRDHDQDPGSSNTQGTVGEAVPRAGDLKPPSQSDNDDSADSAAPPGPSGHNERLEEKTRSASPFSLREVLSGLLAQILACRGRLIYRLSKLLAGSIIAWSRTARYYCDLERASLSFLRYRAAPRTSAPGVDSLADRAAGRRPKRSGRWPALHPHRAWLGLHSPRRSSLRRTPNCAASALPRQYHERKSHGRWTLLAPLGHTATIANQSVKSSIGRHAPVNTRPGCGVGSAITSHDLSLDVC